ncbi:hypothetical protein GH714_037028 [Hevea brasiliensis]|uniref:LysM domain-containing protein n=1 Tax=Hevea brasiliensis TaxID=3981 RepID=A0A6A6L5H4_HEVBR|nr:hypothetical protein GH714_037028 [Hevea brasiliensis]
MARFSTQAAMFVKLIVLVSLLFMISAAECRQIGIGFRDGKSTAECDSVYGAEDGNTCESVAQKFKLTLEFFTSINPNLNCDDIFVGQWLCIDGTA